MARGRWKYDEATGECVEETPSPASEPAPPDPDLERRKREREERDAHPGNYL